MTPRVYCFVGSKGGVGTTTIAVEIAKRFRERGHTLLIDGDLSGRRSGAVIFNRIEALDVQHAVAEVAVVEAEHHLNLMELTPNIHGGFTIKAEQVESFFVRGVQGTESFIVLDAPQPFAAAVRPFAVRAACFVLVVEPSMLGLTGARSMQLELLRFGVPASRLRTIVAQRFGKGEMSRAEIEKMLEIPVLGEVPADSDRKYAAALADVAKNLDAIEPAELMSLQPSSASPLGERRMRRGGDAKPGETAVPKPEPGKPHKKARFSGSSRDALKAAIHAELSKSIDFASISAGNAQRLRPEELRAMVTEMVTDAVAKRDDIGSAEEVARLKQEIIAEALGLGPLEDLMADPDVTEIMVNGPEDVYVERGGKIARTTKQFADARQVRLVIERIIAPLGRRIDESVPMVDARLPDGSRVNATIEPLSIDGPTLTIRRFGIYRMGPEDLIAIGSLTPQIADLLRACVEARLNVVISGGTGSGKTTLLNILSGFIPPNERIVTVEDAAELQLHQEHVVRLEARPANVEGRGEIRIRDLVRNSLRMRPDRIVVGECRGGEALDMLQAMNTGHDGSLTTIHANTPRDCISRIETMVLMSGYDIPVRAVREQIAGAVDVIVQTARMRDGSRKITSVSEVVGMEGEVVTLQDIVKYVQEGLDKEERVAGEFVFTGVQPTFVRRFAEYGVSFDIERLSEMQLAASGW